MLNDQPLGTGSNGLDPSSLPQSGPDQEQMAYQQPQQEQETDDRSELENLVDFALQEANLAKKFKNKKLEDGTLLLDKIGNEIHEGFTKDEASTHLWRERNKEWLKLAMLVREDKSFPWPKASNVKYPMLATAAMQFSARAYPALVPSDGQVVKARTVGFDPTGELTKRAERVAKHMSYQVMCKIPNWEEEMDKLLMTMAISGVCFKKTYHDSILDTHMSKIVYPENFVVNYWAKSIEKAYRKTEILNYTDNEYMEKVRNEEEFLDIELPDPTNVDAVLSDITPITPSQEDEATPHTFLACHTYWDLDNDGYEEPYIITVHKATKKVVRIIARWDSKGVHKNDKGKVALIEPVEYFTSYPFIPNPDGSIYGLGFGLLLGPLNESVNSLINQLVDAGSLSNLQSGFIGKGLRIKVGGYGFQPGEWKVVNATGDDIKKQIFPLPVKEPSSTLMSLLQMLIQSGNQLASIAEIFVGKMPGQNTPATTTQETVKQGMAVFTAIYKRVYRSLHEEFKKIFRLNRITPHIAEEEAKVLGIPLQGSDYSDDYYIVPGADPSGDSESTRESKIGMVGQMLQMGTIDPMAYTQWALQARDVPNWQKLLAQPQPPKPDPKMETEKMKQETMMMKAQSDAKLAEQKLELEKALAELEIQLQQKKLEFEQTKQAMDLQGKQQDMQMNQVMQAEQMKMDQAQMQHDAAANQMKTQMDLQATKAETEMKLDTQKQMHKQKIKQGEESFNQKQAQQKATAKTTSKKGNS